MMIWRRMRRKTVSRSSGTDGLVPYVGLVPGAGLVPRTYTEEEIPSLKRNDVTYPGYALCLPRFALLNGQYVNYPASNPLPYGYLSEVLSDEEGVLPDGTEISIRFNQKFTSVGVTLTFNDLSGDHVSELTMSWYEDDELLSSMGFYTDVCGVFFCSNYVFIITRSRYSLKRLQSLQACFFDTHRFTAYTGIS